MAIPYIKPKNCNFYADPPPITLINRVYNLLKYAKLAGMCIVFKVTNHNDLYTRSIKLIFIAQPTGLMGKLCDLQRFPCHPL